MDITDDTFVSHTIVDDNEVLEPDEVMDPDDVEITEDHHNYHVVDNLGYDHDDRWLADDISTINFGVMDLMSALMSLDRNK